MSESTKRAITILQIIPLEPNYITTKEIKEKLEKIDIEFDVSIRTIQRDVEKLSLDFPIIPHKKGWAFIKESKLFQLPSMNFEAALGFNLIQKFLEDKLPPAIIEFLNPYVLKSKEILENDSDYNSYYNKKNYKEWSDKIAVINNNPLILNQVDKNIIDIVYEAVFKNKRLYVEEYQKRDLSIESFETSPLGLVFREDNIYLLCTSDKYDKPIIRALHRIKKVEILSDNINIPKNFKLTDNLSEFDWKISDKSFKLKMEVNKNVSNIFYEKKLSNDQKIIPLKKGNIIVEGTIEDSNRIRFFLYSLSDNIKIIKPRKLVDEFRKIANNFKDFYL